MKKGRVGQHHSFLDIGPDWGEIKTVRWNEALCLKLVQQPRVHLA